MAAPVPFKIEKAKLAADVRDAIGNAVVQQLLIPVVVRNIRSGQFFHIADIKLDVVGGAEAVVIEVGNR